MLLFNDEDKRELLEEVSIYNVCDFLGIEYQNTGCRKSILCPDHLNHNDQHYGSCFIYENTNTAHCFVCNKSFDTIDLLRLNGYGYYDALCQLANLSGSLSRFEKQPDKKQFWLPNLTKEERELIGLYPTKRIKLYYAIQENKPDDRKYDIIFGKEGEDDSFLLYKTLKYNPWFMLQEKNPEGYLSMVLHSLFYSCPEYKSIYGTNHEGRSCNNRLTLVDFERMLNHLNEKSYAPFGQEVNLTDYTWTEKGVTYKVLEHKGGRYKVLMLNKKAVSK